MGPNGQKPRPSVGAALVGASTAGNGMAWAVGATWRITRTENSRVERVSGAISAPVIDVSGIHHAPGIVQFKVLTLVASESHPLVLGRKSLKDKVLVLSS